jgi:hypothetical protein
VQQGGDPLLGAVGALGASQDIDALDLHQAVGRRCTYVRLWKKRRRGVGGASCRHAGAH